MESEAVLFDLKNLLLVLDEGYYLLDVVWDVFEMSVEIIVLWYWLQLDLFMKLVVICMEQFCLKIILLLVIFECLNVYCEELYEFIVLLNNIFNFYMFVGQEVEYCFVMGELLDEVLEICQWLVKFIEMLCGLVELFFNDLSEKIGSYDIVCLYWLILQMNCVLGMFEV